MQRLTAGLDLKYPVVLVCLQSHRHLQNSPFFIAFLLRDNAAAQPGGLSRFDRLNGAGSMSIFPDVHFYRPGLVMRSIIEHHIKHITDAVFRSFGHRAQYRFGSVNTAIDREQLLKTGVHPPPPADILHFGHQQVIPLFQVHRHFIHIRSRGPGIGKHIDLLAIEPDGQHIVAAQLEQRGCIFVAAHDYGRISDICLVRGKVFYEVHLTVIIRRHRFPFYLTRWHRIARMHHIQHGPDIRFSTMLGEIIREKVFIALDGKRAQHHPLFDEYIRFKRKYNMVFLLRKHGDRKEAESKGQGD